MSISGPEELFEIRTLELIDDQDIVTMFLPMGQRKLLKMTVLELTTQSPATQIQEETPMEQQAPEEIPSFTRCRGKTFKKYQNSLKARTKAMTTNLTPGHINYQTVHE